MDNPQYLYYDGARVSSESALGKELMKHERTRTGWTPEANPFPKMLYRAQHLQGKRSVHEVLDSKCGGYAGAAEQWSRQCQLTVGNEAEMQRAFENGWRATPQDALAYLESRDNEISNITAARQVADSTMGPVAQREAAEADQSTLKHLPEIREKRKRGRPRKTAESIAG